MIVGGNEITCERLIDGKFMQQIINDAVAGDTSSLLAILYHVNALSTRLAQAYQVIGAMAGAFGVFDHPDVMRALDNAACGDKYHADLLPWPRSPLQAVPEPVLKSVERILGDYSAWITAPVPEVVQSIALQAVVAARYCIEQLAMDDAEEGSS